MIIKSIRIDDYFRQFFDLNAKDLYNLVVWIDASGCVDFTDLEIKFKRLGRDASIDEIKRAIAFRQHLAEIEEDNFIRNTCQGETE